VWRSRRTTERERGRRHASAMVRVQNTIEADTEDAAMEDADVIATAGAATGIGAGEAVNDREVLWVWYPVGIALALLAASGVFAFCFSGRWIG
jgi:hypothetical protein